MYTRVGHNVRFDSSSSSSVDAGRAVSVAHYNDYIIIIIIMIIRQNKNVSRGIRLLYTRMYWPQRPIGKVHAHTHAHTQDHDEVVLH